MMKYTLESIAKNAKILSKSTEDLYEYVLRGHTLTASQAKALDKIGDNNLKSLELLLNDVTKPVSRE